MLKTIGIEKYKGLKNRIDLKDLSKVNYLIGKNNAGKTSVLEAISICSIRRTADGMNYENSAVLSDYATSSEYFNQGNTSEAIHIEFGFESGGNTSVVISVDERGTAFRNPSLSINSAGIPKALFIPCTSQIIKSEDTSNSRQITNSVTQSGRININQVSSWVYFSEKKLVGDWNNKMSAEFTSLKQVIDEIFGIEIHRPENDEQGNKIFKYSENGSTPRNLYLLGSGTRSLIYLASAIVYAGDYDLILIDEPELHLHPEAQKKLHSILKKLSSAYNKQIIVSTQSPFLVSNVDKDSAIFSIEGDKVKFAKKIESNTKAYASMLLGAEVSDIGAPENYVLLEEASAQTFIEEVNKRFYGNEIVFISAAGLSNVPNRETALKDFTEREVILKCNPIYKDRYFLITDKINGQKKLKTLQEKLGERFIELNADQIEEIYPDDIVIDYSSQLDDGHILKDIKTKSEFIKNLNGISNRDEKGIEKRKLAFFVGNHITKDVFCDKFSDIVKIFRE